MPQTMMMRMVKRKAQAKSSKAEFHIAAPPLPLKSANDLLRDKRSKLILSQLEKLANAPKDIYQALYQDTIENFAEFVQELPASHMAGFNHQGGLLISGLERALMALKHYRREHPLKNIKPEKMPRQWALYTYALFTAGLFFGLGQVVATYLISTCDKRGRNAECWIPVTGPMTKTDATHYRYVFDAVNRDALAARATTMLAQVLLPEVGFVWLNSDIDVLGYWLAILQNDERHGGLFAKIILAAQRDLIQQTALQTQAAISVQHISDEATETKTDSSEETPKNAEEKARQYDLEQKELVGRHFDIPGLTPGAEITAATIIGAHGGEIMQQLFLNWLRIAVFKNPYFSLNNANSNVMVNSQGIFIRGQDLMKQFMQENNIKSEITQVVKALQKTDTVAVVRQATQKDGTYFVLNKNAVTDMLNTKSLPAMHKSMNLPNISSLQKAYPAIAAALAHSPTASPSA